MRRSEEKVRIKNSRYLEGATFEETSEAILDNNSTANTGVRATLPDGTKIDVEIWWSLPERGEIGVTVYPLNGLDQPVEFATKASPTSSFFIAVSRSALLRQSSL